VTVHVGEEGFREEIREVVEALAPDRIGHGILAASDPELTALLAERGTVLEICPTSNLLTGALPDADAVRQTFRTFVEAGVRVTVSTDGPEMMRTHLRDEFAFLCRVGALDADEARAANLLAHDASFCAAAPQLAPR
jgi:adenosine deaminase